MKKSYNIVKAIVLIILIVSLDSCKKDEPELSNLEILTDSVWDFSNYTSTTANTDIQTWVALAKGFMTDGTLSFFDDGTYKLSSPILVSQNIVETGTWELQGSSLIIFTTNGAPRSATIDDISTSKLVFLETYLYLGTESYTVKSTYLK